MVLHISKVLWTLPVSRSACQSIYATSNFGDFANQPNWPKSWKRLAITCDRQQGSGCLLKASTCCANFYTGLIMALLVLLSLKCNLCFLRNISWLFARSALAQTSVTGSIGKMLSVITTLTGISGFLINFYLILHCATFLQKYISITSWDFSLLSYFLQCTTWK